MGKLSNNSRTSGNQGGIAAGAENSIQNTSMGNHSQSKRQPYDDIQGDKDEVEPIGTPASASNKRLEKISEASRAAAEMSSGK